MPSLPIVDFEMPDTPRYFGIGQQNALREIALRQARGAEAATQGVNTMEDLENALPKLIAANPQVGAQVTNTLSQAASRQDALRMREEELQQLKQNRTLEALEKGVQWLSPALEEPDDAMAEQVYNRGLMQLESAYPGTAKMLGPFNRRNLASMRQRAIPILEQWKEQQKDPYSNIQAGESGMIGYNRNTRRMEQIPGAAPRAPQSMVNITNAQERSEDVEYGKELVGEYKDVRQRAQAAQDLIQNYQIAKSINVEKGAFEPLKARVSAIVSGLNIDPVSIGLPNASNAQALTGIMQNVVLAKLQAQKGPQTENDAKRIESTVASLGNTPEAFDFLLDAGMAMEHMAMEQRDFYDAYRMANPRSSFDGAAKKWKEFRNKTPLLINNPKTGRPIFLHQFRAMNPSASEDEIMAAWRKAAGDK